MASIKKASEGIKQEFGEKTYCHLGSLILKENIFKNGSYDVIHINKNQVNMLSNPKSTISQFCKLGQIA